MYTGTNVSFVYQPIMRNVTLKAYYTSVFSLDAKLLTVPTIYPAAHVQAPVTASHDPPF